MELSYFLFNYSFVVIAVLLAIIYHEFGHYEAAKAYDKKARMKWNKVTWQHPKNDKAGHSNILLMGILAGYLPIFALFSLGLLWWLMGMVIYTVGCGGDFKKFKALRRSIR